MGGCLSGPAEQDHHAVGHASYTNNADDAAAALLESSSLGTRIQLFLKCENLADLDPGRNDKSDPFVVVLVKDPLTGKLQELGRTEVIVNNLNPSFVRTISMTYKFEEIQTLVFRVYDLDEFGPSFDNSATARIDLSKQDFIGECACELASIMGAYGQRKSMPLALPAQGGIPLGKVPRANSVKSRGTLTVHGEELPHQNAAVRLELIAADLPKKCDAFLVLERVKEDMGGVRAHPCYRTEVVRGSASPAWRPFELGVQQLCNANFKQTVHAKVFAWHKGGNHNLLAEAETTLDALLATAAAPTGKTLKLAAPGGAKGGPGSATAGPAAGSLVLRAAQLIALPSFLDYIRGGCQINFNVAIDFTASNGNPADPRSLHFIAPHAAGGDPGALYQRPTNPYVAAITAVGGVLEYYDTDKSFPAYGFGAKIGHQTSHCFSLNGADASPEVHGVHGILEAYQRAIRTHELAGPTYFSEIIQRAAANATHCTQQQQSYEVLLIITDGIINDMDATVSSIVQASTLPLSILIVGVGSANFEAMETLDGDDVRLSNASGTAKRDIVQFVPIRDFADPHTGAIDTVRLARALLDEIPGQLLSYMQWRGMPPNAPRM